MNNKDKKLCEKLKLTPQKFDNLIKLCVKIEQLEKNESKRNSKRKS